MGGGVVSRGIPIATTAKSFASVPAGKLLFSADKCVPRKRRIQSPRSGTPEFLALFFCAFRFFPDLREFLLELLQVVIREFFKIDQLVSRGSESADQFVELEMNGLRVAILSVLNQEDHQEGDDGRASINNELP